MAGVRSAHPRSAFLSTCWAACLTRKIGIGHDGFYPDGIRVAVRTHRRGANESKHVPKPIAVMLDIFIQRGTNYRGTQSDPAGVSLPSLDLYGSDKRCRCMCRSASPTISQPLCQPLQAAGAAH